MEESKEYWQDTVKVVLHVQTQKNWDAGIPLELLGQFKLRMTPNTRPYGLLPGMVFQAQVGLRSIKKGLGTGGGRLIEIERYNSIPLKNPPPDELITFKTKTDPNGVFTFAFPEPGWWCMTAAWQEPGRQWVDSGKQGPLVERATFWLHVDEKK